VFSHERAGDNATAVAALDGVDGGAFLGGGTNLVDLMKLRVARPELLVDVARLPNDRIELLADGGVRIGGAVRNSDQAAIARFVRAIRCWPAHCSRGHRRNFATATTAGNLLQRTRCVYFTRRHQAVQQTQTGSGCPAKPAYHATGVRVRRLPLRSDDFLR